jgi:hypothetical protein
MSSSSRVRRTTKRYVLFTSEEALSEGERKQLAEILENRYGKIKLIPVEGNPRAVIIKTTNETAPRLRDLDPKLTIHEKRLTSVLTSGAIGKLKRRAAPAVANGQVHER